MMEFRSYRIFRGACSVVAAVGILSIVVPAQGAGKGKPAADSASSAKPKSAGPDSQGLPSDDVGPPLGGLPSDDVGDPFSKKPAPSASPAGQAKPPETGTVVAPKDGGPKDGGPKAAEAKPEAAPVQEDVVTVEPAVSEPKRKALADNPDDKLVELETDVVVGYGSMKKQDLTGSVVSVKSDAITREAVFSVRKSLQGKATGVHVTQNSGAPGKPVTVRIRGVGTINASDPLYVVDGIPITGIDFLNPNDIESMTILKDASATAIYGARGANGVVLVTTKKAKDGSRVINYDFSIGTQQPWKKPSLVTAEQWAILRNEAMRAANLPVDEGLEDPSSLGEGTDWFGEITRDNPLVMQQNVSVLRDVGDLKYFLSAGYFSQDGIIKGSALRKTTLRFNAENKVSSWFTLGNSMGVAHNRVSLANETDEWNSVLVNALAMDPVTKPRDAQGNPSAAGYNNAFNPVGIIDHTNHHVKTTSLAGTLYGNIDLSRRIKYRTIVGLDLAMIDTSEFVPKYFISATDNRAEASVAKKSGTDYNIVLENTISYEPGFFSDNQIKMLVGTTAQDRTVERFSAKNTNTPGNDEALRYLDATSGINPDVKGLENGNSLASFFGRMEYDYLNKYLLTATYRQDGSSRFGPAQRWGGFPSAAGAWKLKQEPFLKNVASLDDLKLRAGWGKTGNQEIPDYLFTTTTSGKQNYVFGDQVAPGTTFLSSGNLQIHWEEQEAYNAGIDISVFEGKIEFNADAFIKKTEGMLVRPTIPYIAGLKTSPMVNGGSLENKGIELLLNYREKIGGFTSNLGINFSTYDNKILSLGQNGAPINDAAFRNAGTVTRTEVGRSIGNFYGYKTNGLFQTQEEIDAFTYVDPVDGTVRPVQPNAAPGDIRYQDVDGNGKPDQGYIGSPHPDFIYGMSLDMAYRGFDMNVSLQGVYGNEIFNGGRWYTDYGAAYYNMDTRMLDRWTGPGTTNDVNLPRLNNNDANNMLISDRFIEDGSYLRIKSLQFGYSLTSSLLQLAHITKCRIYVGVENLFTFTDYLGLDPEVGLGEARGETRNTSLTMGVDRATYPQARTFMAGLNLSI
jgi:TonB-linked SusC/RagA family outer membrane protein